MNVSVIIPVYNEEKYLTACLDSLQRQEIKPAEIIVVDNNCTDRSIAIAMQYQTKIIKEKKQGMIYARNAGFNAAKYEIIARCDADTILPQDWIKRIKENFKDNKIDALAGMVLFYDLGILRKFSLPNFGYFYLMRRLLGHEVLAGPGFALTKKIWEKVKNEVCLDDKQVHEDIDLSIHIAKYGRIKFDSNSLIYASARRIKNRPFSFFIEYPIRVIKTLKAH